MLEILKLNNSDVDSRDKQNTYGTIFFHYTKYVHSVAVYKT